jgi:hypothetical protein
MKEFTPRKFPVAEPDDITRYTRRVRELAIETSDENYNRKSYRYGNEVIDVTYADLEDNEQAATRVLTPIPTPPEIGAMAEDRVFEFIITPKEVIMSYDFNVVEMVPDRTPKAPSLAEYKDHQAETRLGLHTIHRNELTELIEKLDTLGPEDKLD